MVTHNNLWLLFLSVTLFLPAHFARPDLSPSPSPGPEPDFSPGPAPVRSPSGGSPPTPSPTARSAPTPSPTARSAPSPSPTSEAADSPDQFDFSDTLAPGADINPMVKQICDSTDHPALCLATIVPRLGGHLDIPTVVEIAIRTTTDLAKIARTLAKRMSNNPRVPIELVSILKDCMDSYDTAVENFESAIDAFPRRDVGTMRSQLSAVITNVGDCNDRYSGSGEDSQFSRVADRLTNMTSNCLAIVSLLQ